jgi:hypothetical protein
MEVAVGMAMHRPAGPDSLSASGFRSQDEAAAGQDAAKRLPRSVAALFILGVSLLCWGLIGMGLRALLS